MSPPPNDLGVRLHALAVAIEGVLVVGASQEHHLRGDYPPFITDDQPTPLDVGLRHFGGGPGPLFDLWCMCRAVAVLRRVWTGQEGAHSAVPVPTDPQPLEETKP